MSKRENIKWANKVVRAKHFVVLTDKESALALDGVDPKSFNDMLALQSQAASLRAFKADLEELIKAHDNRVAELGGDLGITRSKRATSKSKTTTNRKKRVN